MLKENVKKATDGKSYKILETHNLIQVYGDLNIFVDNEKQFYIGIEEHHDRGLPFFEYWKIETVHYNTFKSPNVESLKKLLSVKFFERTLFQVFLQKEAHLKIVHQILEAPTLPNIENTAVKSWFEKEQKIKLDSNVFQMPKSLGEFELPELVYATQFKSDTLVEIDVLHTNSKDNILQIQKCLLNIETKEVVKGKVITMEQGLPFFTFAKDYPIKSVTFGNRAQFTAKAGEQEANGNTKKIVLLNDSKEFYQYEYPSTSNLGRFWIFKEESTTDAFKNSVLFMYSIRDHTSKEDYVILRFEIQEEKVIPMTKIITKGNSRISFSPNGRMIYSLIEEQGIRSKQLNIVQL